VKKFSFSNVLMAAAAALLLVPYTAVAQQTTDTAQRAAAARVSADQQNVPQPVQGAAAATERTARRFGVGVEGGIALDPELIEFGGHATFGPVFRSSVTFRPGIEFGLGEVTTLFGVNLDVLYELPGSDGGTRWSPYVGAGPNFTLSHRGFGTDEVDKVNTGTTTTTTTTTAATGTDTGRFDFSDTDFSGGFNFIAGARNQNGLFVEMKATAWGVSNVRLLAGFTF
jgi:hypothetical protein